MSENTALLEYEYKGIKYNRISMMNSLKIQKKIAGLFDKLDLVSFLSVQVVKTKEEKMQVEASRGIQLVKNIYNNIEEFEDIFEICVKDIDKLMAGQEFDLIEGLIDHPDFKVIIEKLKGMGNVKGKIENLFKSKK